MAEEAKFEIGIKALILNDRNRILVLKAGEEELRYEKQDFWDLPGGRIQLNSDIEETLRREINEELGIPGSTLRINGIFDASISNFKITRKKEKLSLMLITYECGLSAHKEFKISKEHSEYRWMPVNVAARHLGKKFPKAFVDKLRKL
ncbi:MAG: NUDIX hydrolase [Candidatus Micrarchaeota archaeon]|nr:NUDIX hydrolase [Candidatus Micrarchaeota archaeon]